MEKKLDTAVTDQMVVRHSPEDWVDKITRNLAVFPVGPDKRPAVDPSTGRLIRWQDLLINKRNVKHFMWPSTSPALKCGRSSNNLECLDLDNKAPGESDRNLEDLRGMLEIDHPGLYERLYIERSQSGGYHILYHCPEGVGQNIVLAKRQATAEELALSPQHRIIATIETRGEGGYVVVAPAPGYTPIQGELNSYPIVTAAERQSLFNCARSLTQAVSSSEVVGKGSSYANEARWRLRPGDDFNQRGDIKPILLRAGWAEISPNRWRRPGKSQGAPSASLDHIPGVFFVFSTGAEPFRPGVAYDYFGVYAIIEHGGNFIEAAAKLHEMGYGRGLPRIVKTADVRQMVLHAWECLNQAWEEEGEPQVYRSPSGGLCVWRKNPDTLRPEIVSLVPDSLRLILQANSFWCTVKEKKDGEIIETPATPPKEVLSSMLASTEKPLPPLRRVVGVPVFIKGSRGEARLLDRAGYDQESGVYYLPTIDIPSISPDPSEEEVAAARSMLLDELLGDFPFEEASSRSHALGLALLPYLRGLIEGPTPFHLVDAPIQGSGKGLLVQALLLPYVGEALAFTSETESAEEWRKRLVSLANEGADYVWIDNITRDIDWSSVAAALTSQSIRERLLGGNEIPTIPLRVVWAGTANNASLGEDMVRRVVYIRINWTNHQVADPAELKPETFRHPYLLQWIAENRAKIVWSCLTLCVAGMAKKVPAAAHKNSFDEWSVVVGGILAGLGIEGFLGNRSSVDASIDHTNDTIFELLEMAHQTFGERPFQAKDLVDALAAAPMLMPSNVKAPTKWVGRLFTTHRDRTIGHLTLLLHASSRTAGHVWRVVASTATAAVQPIKES